MNVTLHFTDFVSDADLQMMMFSVKFNLTEFYSTEETSCSRLILGAHTKREDMSCIFRYSLV